MCTAGLQVLHLRGIYYSCIVELGNNMGTMLLWAPQELLPHIPAGELGSVQSGDCGAMLAML